MNEIQWNAFTTFRDSYKELCNQWNSTFAEELKPLQKSASEKDTPPYPLETPVVYNTAYDSVTKQDEIKLIVVGDNPGKEEQLLKNQKYLVGQSGRIAQGFFAKNPNLKTDFRKNAIILNKTPVHTAKTPHLKFLKKFGSERIANLIQESQITVAKMTAALHQALTESCQKGESVPQLWLVGYTELKNKGIFVPYRDTLTQSYLSPSNEHPLAWDNVFVYQHFSMNRFLIDLKQFHAKNPNLNLPQSLNQLGKIHKEEIFLPL